MSLSVSICFSSLSIFRCSTVVSIEAEAELTAEVEEGKEEAEGDAAGAMGADALMVITHKVEHETECEKGRKGWG